MVTVRTQLAKREGACKVFQTSLLPILDMRKYAKELFESLSADEGNEYHTILECALLCAGCKIITTCLRQSLASHRILQTTTNEKMLVHFPYRFVIYKPIGLCATRSADILILTNGTCDMYCVTACWRKSCMWC